MHNQPITSLIHRPSLDPRSPQSPTKPRSICTSLTIRSSNSGDKTPKSNSGKLQSSFLYSLCQFPRRNLELKSQIAIDGYPKMQSTERKADFAASTFARRHRKGLGWGESRVNEYCIVCLKNFFIFLLFSLVRFSLLLIFFDLK